MRGGRRGKGESANRFWGREFRDLGLGIWLLDQGVSLGFELGNLGVDIHLTNVDRLRVTHVGRIREDELREVSIVISKQAMMNRKFLENILVGGENGLKRRIRVCEDMKLLHGQIPAPGEAGEHGGSIGSLNLTGRGTPGAEEDGLSGFVGEVEVEEVSEVFGKFCEVGFIFLGYQYRHVARVTHFGTRFEIFAGKKLEFGGY